MKPCEGRTHPDILAPMSDPSMDFLPGGPEHKRLRKRLSPAAYEKLRESVKGPEQMERELKKAEQLAELHFALESDEKLQEKAKDKLAKAIKEQGIEAVVDTEKLSPEQKKALEQGRVRLAVSSHPVTHQDQLVAIPEGKVQEKIPLKQSFSDGYAAQLKKAA